MRFLLKLALVCLLLFGVTASAGAALFLYYSRNLPDPTHLGDREVTQSTKIYDRTGTVLLYEIHGEEKRTVIAFGEIPEHVKRATIAVEDDNFYNHPAFDWKAIIRALLVDIVTLKPTQGGSTITQQLVKNAFLSREKILPRKIKELTLALQLEQRYTKDEILGFYLNQVPYGSNAYGIEAASQTFFNKPARELTLAQSALLAALARGPSYYSPYGSHLDELKARQEFILDRMRELGYITDEELASAKEEELSFFPPATSIKAPHFVLFVREYLSNKYGEALVERGGLKVITTLNWDYQQVAERVVAEGAARNLEKYGGGNAALVAQDPKTGQVLAMVGSADYFDIEHDGNFNVATQGLRQPGSAFKPFAYLTAFKKGYTPDTVVFDLPTEFDTTGNPEKSYQPHNYDKIFRGPMTLRNALAQSVNIPAVKTLYLAGISDTIDTAERLGLSTLTDRSRFGLSLVLGGGEVRLLEMVGAYGVFAQEGTRHQRAIILRVEDARGGVVEEYRDRTETIFAAQPIRLLNSILSDNDARAPLFGYQNLLLVPGHVIAAKTGTTNDFRDAWTIGYTPALVAGVWAGNNDNSPMNIGGVSILAATPIWNAFMSEALKEMPLELFTKPDPLPVNKPSLSGVHIVEYPVGNDRFPQVHDILFYVDRNNPQGKQPENPEDDAQFQNWEAPVLAWAKENIPNFEELYNKPIPPTYQIMQSGQYRPLVSVISPENGSFVTSPLTVRAKASAPLGISSLTLLLNGRSVHSVAFAPPAATYASSSLLSTTSSAAASPAPGTPIEYDYVYALQNVTFELQNKLTFELVDMLGNQATEEVIVFR